MCFRVLLRILPFSVKQYRIPTFLTCRFSIQNKWLISIFCLYIFCSIDFLLRRISLLLPRGPINRVLWRTETVFSAFNFSALFPFSSRLFADGMLILALNQNAFESFRSLFPADYFRNIYLAAFSAAMRPELIANPSALPLRIKQ